MTSESNRGYAQVAEEISRLEIDNKKKVFVFILSLLMSVLIVSGPIAVLINLMIYNDLEKLLVLLISTILIIFVALLDLFYLKGITEGKVKSLGVIIAFDTFIVALVIYAIVLILFYMGVF